MKIAIKNCIEEVTLALAERYILYRIVRSSDKMYEEFINDLVVIGRLEVIHLSNISKEIPRPGFSCLYVIPLAKGVKIELENEV